MSSLHWTIFFGLLCITMDLFLCKKVGAVDLQTLPIIAYTPAMLRSLRPTCSTTCSHRQHPFPQQQQRKRGKKGGLRAKFKRRGTRPFIPSIILGNARSLNNKLDELEACCRHLNQYRNASIMTFTETWFTNNNTEQDTDITGFNAFRGDRDKTASGKKSGGGVCVYINNRYANKQSVTIKEHICTPEVEILSLAVRPYYLPREFSAVLISAVYVPPSSSSTNACDVIASVVNRQENSSPDAIKLIMGDFNHRELTATLPHFHQYVFCATRGSHTIDLCYGNVDNAYISYPLPPLGNSDHNNILLMPKYRPILRKTKPVVKTVLRWDPEAIEKMRGCMDCTDWDMFKEACTDIDELTDTISGYINFCSNIVLYPKQVTIYPNNKPWVTKDLRYLIQEKHKAFRDKDFARVKCLKKELKQTIQKCKEDYKNKLENQFRNNNMRKLWNSLKEITGSSKAGMCVNAANELDYSNELNAFYCRFDCQDFKKEQTSLKDNLSLLSVQSEKVYVSELEVRNEFKKLKLGKASGPDKITPLILKYCSEQLCSIFCFIYNHTLECQVIPAIWKKAEVIPVPKKSKIYNFNDLRPVALTSTVMKCLEKLVLRKLMEDVTNTLDPMQFAYKEKSNVEDAVLVFLNSIIKHLETPKTYVRVLFVDFSSAFNTIQPHLMVQKLLRLNVKAPIVAWLLDFLTCRTQYVKLNSVVSDTISINTGAPQGCVLSPVLYTIYTNDYRSHFGETKLIKFADDSTILGLLSNSEESYRSEIDLFAKWCQDNYLMLNVLKTKELVIDFRTKIDPTLPLSIDGTNVTTVDSYKYLGITIDENLKWSKHIYNLSLKLNQRLYFLRKLNAFKVSKEILHLFYNANIQSLISFGISCWGGSALQKDKEKINKLIRRAAKITEVPLPTIDMLYEEIVTKKAINIINDPAHPLNAEFILSNRKNRILQHKCRTNRYLNSFVPNATKLLNAKSALYNSENKR